MTTGKKTIAVAMSGGVDSSVTAAMLKQQGHRVIGITMRLFSTQLVGPGTAAYDAAAVAAQLAIPHHIFDLQTQFRDTVIDPFISEYRCGRTPNPCVACNQSIKFGLLLEQARALGADLLATGHYVRKTCDPDGTCHLRTANNQAKDQSYFLYTLSQARLAQVLFPLGEIASKEEVRRLGREFGLPVAEKGDSQEVCFIPNDDYVAFLEANGVPRAHEGKIIHPNGRLLGCHQGTHRYTIGQRKGLGIAWKEPLYVIGLDAEQNRVIAGELPLLSASGLQADHLSWVMPPEENRFAARCKIRYRHRPVPCQVTLLPNGECTVQFAEAQKAVAPGQAVVFYRGDEVLGGGRITTALVVDQEATARPAAH